jgi:hypothetical protein
MSNDIQSSQIHFDIGPKSMDLTDPIPDLDGRSMPTEVFNPIGCSFN